MKVEYSQRNTMYAHEKDYREKRSPIVRHKIARTIPLHFGIEAGPEQLLREALSHRLLKPLKDGANRGKKTLTRYDQIRNANHFKARAA